MNKDTLRWWFLPVHIKYRINRYFENRILRRIARNLPDKMKVMVVADMHAEWSYQNPTAICGTHVTIGEIMDALGKERS